MTASNDHDSPPNLHNPDGPNINGSETASNEKPDSQASGKQNPNSPNLNIVLFQPEIPGNTGAVGRTCVALGAKLWLVRPLGFRVDEKTLRRAGLDYWKHLDWEVADHWDDLLERMTPSRLWFFTRFATKSYASVEFQEGDTFVFGAETSGLPKSLTEPNPDQLLRVPTTGKVRSLNLATTVGIAAFEAARQFGVLDRLEI